MKALRSVKGWLRSEAEFAKTLPLFVNWPAVCAAHLARRPLPPLRLRCGLTLHHTAADMPLQLLGEIFRGRSYTQPGFYTPRPADVVVDLGGNIGVFVLYLQTVARGITVHAFEPSSRALQVLRKNVHDNGLDPYVSVHPQAVGGAEGKLVLNVAAQSGHNSLFEAPHLAGSVQEQVECVTLDGALGRCGTAPVDLLKIDVEAAELDILRGASPQAWARVRRTVIETHDCIRPGCHEAVVDTLRRLGFTLDQVVNQNGLGCVMASRPNGSP